MDLAPAPGARRRPIDGCLSLEATTGSLSRSTWQAAAAWQGAGAAGDDELELNTLVVTYQVFGSFLVTSTGGCGRQGARAAGGGGGRLQLCYRSTSDVESVIHFSKRFAGGSRWQGAGAAGGGRGRGAARTRGPVDPRRPGRRVRRRRLLRAARPLLGSGVSKFLLQVLCSAGAADACAAASRYAQAACRSAGAAGIRTATSPAPQTRRPLLSQCFWALAAASK